VRRLRLAKQYESAWSLMRSMPPEVSDLVAPDIWWGERRIHVRAALNAGKPRTAYAIASGRGPLSGENLAEAEFLAGWIAYRYLDDPELALKHFETSKSADALPRDVARGAYFLGRVKRDLKREADARREFEDAASRYYAYYGQLAIQALNGAAPCSFRPPVHPTAEQIKSFVEDDAVLAVAIARQLDLDRLVRVLLIGYARELTDPADMTLAFELARRLAPQNFVVRIAKAALNRGFPVDAYGFPLALPEFEAAEGGADVEAALLHALTRQESEFNTDAKSPVGARGLMQLMPATARMVASQNKLKYDLSRLTSDPAYNVTLGAAFLDSLITSYRGSYVMAVAAYNAGPGRVRQWVREFGDPRDRNIDPVDWVERIPLTETRNYVQRVLEGLQLYRCRAERAKADVLLVQDLWRGRPDAKLIEARMSNGLSRP
jgi:soluble lytic murein transglycosylase